MQIILDGHVPTPEQREVIAKAVAAFGTVMTLKYYGDSVRVEYDALITSVRITNRNRLAWSMWHKSRGGDQNVPKWELLTNWDNNRYWGMPGIEERGPDYGR